MLKHRIEYMALCASAAFALSGLPAAAGSLSVATTYVLASPIGAQYFGSSDLLDSFVEYYYEKGVQYDTIAMTADVPASIITNICEGNSSGYDLVMLPGNFVYELRRRCPSRVIGAPFIFAYDSVSLYSYAVDISKGLPSSLRVPIGIADPKADPYGFAAAQILATTPGSVYAKHHGLIETFPDTSTVKAAIEDVAYGAPSTVQYGFVAKSQICLNFGGLEYYNFDTDLYHHNYLPGNPLHPYWLIPLVGIKVANKRTPDQEKELNRLVAFTLGIGTTLGTDGLKGYCMQLPAPNSFPGPFPFL